MKLSYMLIALVFLQPIVNADVVTKIYTIPLGAYLQAEDSNTIDSLISDVEKKEAPSIKYEKKEKDEIVSFKNIRVLFKDPNDKIGNYNKLLDFLVFYSKSIKQVDSSVIKRSVQRLKARE